MKCTLSICKGAFRQGKKATCQCFCVRSMTMLCQLLLSQNRAQQMENKFEIKFKRNHVSHWNKSTRSSLQLKKALTLTSQDLLPSFHSSAVASVRFFRWLWPPPQTLVPSSNLMSIQDLQPERGSKDGTRAQCTVGDMAFTCFFFFLAFCLLSYWHGHFKIHFYFCSQIWLTFLDLLKGQGFFAKS